MKPITLNAFDFQNAGAICCATAIRLGGALDVMTRSTHLGNAYSRVDCGVQAVLAWHQDEEVCLDDTVSEGFAASWHLSTAFPRDHFAFPFFQSGGKAVAFAFMTSRETDPEEQLRGALHAATEAAESWPGSNREGSTLEILNFEEECQRESLIKVQEFGIGALRDLAISQASVYRRAAESLHIR
ncbi:hypothetical protein [Streptomyces hydrogenans]